MTIRLINIIDIYKSILHHEIEKSIVLLKQFSSSSNKVYKRISGSSTFKGIVSHTFCVETFSGANTNVTNAIR